MTNTSTFSAGTYQMAADRYYDEATHLWIKPESSNLARCGFDPLGSDTNGDLVSLSFEPVGTNLVRGQAFGNLEAAKFVGPLVAPVSGRITAYNEAVLTNPGLVNQDPLAHWLVELELLEPDRELANLLREPEQVRAWIERDIERFKRKGMIAE